MIDIILASQSPIRKKLMEDIGLSFEIIISHADETPNESLSFEEQLKDIAMKKAQVVLNKTECRGKRIIVAADQNMFFNGTMYGKPKTMDEARSLIKSMEGSNKIYAYTGNAILYADEKNVIDCINNYDIARMSMEQISNENLENYLNNYSPLNKCGGITLSAPFIHLEEGKESTALGMTIEFLQEMIERVEKAEIL